MSNANTMKLTDDVIIKFSVITIVRNGKPFVAQTISSVLSQDYLNFEYIVIDGASTDGTVDLIRQQEARISKWVSEPDQGIADAFNKGLSFATGDYVLFLNSDDMLAGANVLEKMARKIKQAGFPALIYGDCDVLERESGEVLYRASIQYSPTQLRLGQMLPHPSMFAQRACFEKCGVFDTKFKIGMDYEWLLRCALKEKVVHVTMLVTRVRSGGMSTQNRARVVDEIILAQKKNGCISSPWGEYKLRAYFALRLLARKVLGAMNIYKSKHSG